MRGTPKDRQGRGRAANIRSSQNFGLLPLELGGADNALVAQVCNAFSRAFFAVASDDPAGPGGLLQTLMGAIRERPHPIEVRLASYNPAARMLYQPECRQAPS